LTFPNLRLSSSALLDVGVYAVSFTSFVLGEPVRVESMMTPAPTGVDAQAACILGYDGGELALVSTALTTNTPWEATILGTNGKIRLHASAWHPTKMTVSISGQPDDLQEFDAHETGFYYEVEEVGNCLRAGKVESDILPLDESLGIMRTLDRIRAPWGLKYPSEA
jgi:predicted dehydrogenase